MRASPNAFEKLNSFAGGSSLDEGRKRNPRQTCRVGSTSQKLLFLAKGGKKMKSETIPVQQVFQDRRQYLVPFYQRAYVLNKEE
jgi:hypothetical protein